jgi:Domain of unknown function (DUF1707)
VFDGDPHERAKDRDRDRATYVIDAALRNGQITQQDRDLRAERVRSAATIGELASLTRDIATPPAPVPPTAVVPPARVPTPPDPYGPGSSRPIAGVPSDLYGDGPTDTDTDTTTLASGKGLKAKPAAGRKVALGCALVVALFVIAPLAAGLVIFASSDTGNDDVTTEPVQAGPPFELSTAGFREYVAAFEETFGDTQVVRTVFYDGYVVAWVPQDDGKVALWNYVDGVFDQLGDPMDGAAEPTPVDLADLRPGRVMRLVREVESFGLVGNVTTYVIYDRDVIDDFPHLMVYVNSDDGRSGYLIGDLDGRVLTSTPPS